MSDIEYSIQRFVEDIVPDICTDELGNCSFDVSQIDGLEDEVVRIMEDNINMIQTAIDPRKFFETCVNILKSGWDAHEEVRSLRKKVEELSETCNDLRELNSRQLSQLTAQGHQPSITKGTS